MKWVPFLVGIGAGVLIREIFLRTSGTPLRAGEVETDPNSEGRVPSIGQRVSFPARGEWFQGVVSGPLRADGRLPISTRPEIVLALSPNQFHEVKTS